MKYVVMQGNYNKNTNVTDFEQCIGVFESHKEAYGEAVLFLNELICDRDEEGLTISAIYDLEGNTGCGMSIVGQAKFVDFAHIYFFDDGKKNIDEVALKGGEHAED